MSKYCKWKKRKKSEENFFFQIEYCFETVCNEFEMNSTFGREEQKLSHLLYDFRYIIINTLPSRILMYSNPHGLHLKTMKIKYDENGHFLIFTILFSLLL